MSLISNWIDDDPGGLHGRIAGHVAVPGDTDWDQQRAAWNLAADQHPVAVALPESSDDVIAIVEFARERGLRVAAQGTGHNATAALTVNNAPPPGTGLCGLTFAKWTAAIAVVMWTLALVFALIGS